MPLSRVRALNARRNSRAESPIRKPIVSLISYDIIAVATIFNTARACQQSRIWCKFSLHRLHGSCFWAGCGDDLDRRPLLVLSLALLLSRDCPLSRARRQPRRDAQPASGLRSEEHTSELQSLMRISYAVFCLKTTTT